MGFPYWILSILIIPTLIIIGGAYIIESSYEQKVNHQISEMVDKIHFQKQRIESDFSMIIKSQEGFTKQPEWKTLSYVNSHDRTIGGIPQNVEVNKRNIAKYMVDKYGFQSFGITTLDGQMYLLEPFEDQLSLSKYNFADREWFQGVLNYKETFVSDVFVSSATNHPIIVISAPLFSEEGNIIGMWGGGMDLEFLTSYLDEIRERTTSITLIDDKGTVIADTNDSSYHEKASEDMLRFESYQKNYFYDSDSKMHVFHTTIKLQTKEWSLFSTIEEDNFLVVEKQKKVEAYTLLSLIQVFLVVITFFVFRNIKRTHQLTQNLQENQEKLVQIERLSAIGEVSARIAHDIKNPLNNIRLSTQLIDKKISNEELKPYFKTIEKNIFRIVHQIDDVLDFLRDTHIKKEEVNIRYLIDGVINNMQIPENISISISECSFKVNVDKIKMESVFSNLILNSMQAIGNNEGKIKILIEQKNSQCHITVEDSGKGIKSENIHKIFEPLFTTKLEGTGLGLSTIKNIIEMHQGVIKVEINPTRFIIQIPKH